MYKNSKYTILFPLLLAAGVVLGLLLGQYMGRNSTTSQIKGMLRQMALPTNKLTYTLSLIENQYVDSVAMDSLAEHVIPLLVKELDPHSVYIPAAEMQQLNEPLEGEFDGIGVVFNMATDTVIVLNVIPQGPSDKAGIKAGDRIIEINDTLVAGQKIPQRDVVKKLRGPRGTTVHLGLGRQGIGELVGVDVVRDKIPIKSIESAFRIADGIGYIKLGQFARTTSAEMEQALASLRAEGVTKLIFDLRGNSGGYLDQAILVANEFLHKEQLIVYTEDRHHQQQREYADGTGSAQDMDVVVLIDEGPLRAKSSREPCRTTTVVRLLDVVRSERDSYSVRYLTATDRPCGLRRHVITRPRAARSRSPIRSATTKATRRTFGTATGTTSFSRPTASTSPTRSNGRRPAARWFTAAAASCPTFSCRPTRPT